MAIIVNAGTILTDGANGIAIDTDCCCDTSCEYELCDPTSIKYCECDDPGTCIFVDPAVLSGLEPPPGTIEISGTCYEFVEKSLTAIDTFSIDSEPVDCEDAACEELVCPSCDGSICIEVVFAGWTGGGFACTFINNSCTVSNTGPCTWSENGQPCNLSQAAVSCLDWGGGMLGPCVIPAGVYWRVYGSPNGGSDSFIGYIPVLAGETYPGSLGGGPRVATLVCDDAGCGDGTVTAEGVTCI